MFLFFVCQEKNCCRNENRFIYYYRYCVKVCQITWALLFREKSFYPFHSSFPTLYLHRSANDTMQRKQNQIKIKRKEEPNRETLEFDQRFVCFIQISGVFMLPLNYIKLKLQRNILYNKLIIIWKWWTENYFYVLKEKKKKRESGKCVCVSMDWMIFNKSIFDRVKVLVSFRLRLTLYNENEIYCGILKNSFFLMGISHLLYTSIAKYWNAIKYIYKMISISIF